jgi:hypothetical protein
LDTGCDYAAVGSVAARRAIEKIGYDDLNYAALKLRKRLDYGYGSAPEPDDGERTARRDLVEEVVDQLIRYTTTEPTGAFYAIDATGQWSWNRGENAEKKRLERALEDAGGDASAAEGALGDLRPGEIGHDAGNTAPAGHEQPAPKSAAGRARCLDAAWGYKTNKFGIKELGVGFHMHAMVRVPEVGEDAERVPQLVDGFILAPANANVAETSLRLVRRVKARNPYFKTLIGDKYYTNLVASSWAVPLAKLGIMQHPWMRENTQGITAVLGALLQYGWLHCPSTPMHLRPQEPGIDADAETWQRYTQEVQAFKDNWAFDRHASGLLASNTSKWKCQAEVGRVVCAAKGAPLAEAANGELPVVIPPDDWEDRACCSQKIISFTPEIDNPAHQRKLMQKEYVGTLRWKLVANLRSTIEGVFGIMKNPSRHRMRPRAEPRCWSRLQLDRGRHQGQPLQRGDPACLARRDWARPRRPRPPPSGRPYFGHRDLTEAEATRSIEAHFAQPAAALAA